MSTLRATLPSKMKRLINPNNKTLGLSEEGKSDPVKVIQVMFQKRVRVFNRGFKHEKTDESTRPQAECFYRYRMFETPMKHEARVFEITSPTKEN